MQIYLTDFFKIDNEFRVTVGQKAKFVCLVNVTVYIKASKKVSFQLPKNKGEITTLYITLTVK